MRAQVAQMTAEEFIRWELQQPGRHEFHAGEVFAMAGGSPRHNKIASMIVATAQAAFRGRKKPCDALGSDQMVAVNRPAAGQSFVYPDVTVVCGDAEYLRVDQGLLLLNPSAVFEVLSESTEGYDRGDKFKLYRARPSLRDYLLVSQRELCIEHWQLTNTGWTLIDDDARAGATVTLDCGARLSVDDVYEGCWRFPGDDGV